MIKNIARALRLPFISASILPFVFGSLIKRDNFNFKVFLLGLVAVIATHLSANLINDYADSRSGADWQDKKFYKFFGGSKLIQENVFSERFYLNLAIFFAAFSFIAAIGLSILLQNVRVIIFYALIIALSWMYSEKPLQFSYRRWGEVLIFILFGPALVMGGYFIQTQIFPDLRSFILSLPFGFLTSALLFSNEVPDYDEDEQAGKFTLVNLTGKNKAFLLYYLLISAAFLSILSGIVIGFLKPYAFISFIAFLPAIKAASILKAHFQDKPELINSSKLTIATQTLVSLILIVSI